jgi:hypothetical protein
MEEDVITFVKRWRYTLIAVVVMVISLLLSSWFAGWVGLLVWFTFWAFVMIKTVTMSVDTALSGQRRAPRSRWRARRLHRAPSATGGLNVSEAAHQPSEVAGYKVCWEMDATGHCTDSTHNQGGHLKDPAGLHWLWRLPTGHPDALPPKETT